MPSKSEYPKYAYEKTEYSYIIVPKPADINSRYQYFYYCANETNNDPSPWGTLEDYESWWDRGALRQLQLKHLLQFQTPIEGQKKKFVIAFINDLIADIKENHK